MTSHTQAIICRKYFIEALLLGRVRRAELIIVSDDFGSVQLKMLLYDSNLYALKSQHNIKLYYVHNICS